MNELTLSEKITSLDLVHQINHFRSLEDNKSEIGHNDLLKIIRDEFEDEIDEGKISQISYKDSMNRKQPMFVLTISQAKQVLIRESKSVRKAVIHVLENVEKKVKEFIEQSATEQLKKIEQSSFAFDKLLTVATLFGLKGNQALISANVATRKITGVDLQATLGIEMKSDDNEQLLTATQIGKELDGSLSAIKVNLLLIEHDYQGKNEAGYFPLSKGEPFATMIDSGKKHSDGSMIQQLKWKRSIIDEIKAIVLGEKK